MKPLRPILLAVLLASLLCLAVAPPAASAPLGSGAKCAQYHLVRTGDRLFRLALRYGSTVPALTTLNGLANPNRILVGQILCVRAGSISTTPYVVKRGDTLFAIGRRFGWSVTYLATVNSLANPNRILVGQVLAIPAH